MWSRYPGCACSGFSRFSERCAGVSWGLLVPHSVGGLLGFDRGVGNGVGVWSGLLRLWGACFGGGVSGFWAV